MPKTNLRRLSSRLLLAQDRDDLLLGEPALLHRPALPWGSGL